jgi:hypothetical protein
MIDALRLSTKLISALIGGYGLFALYRVATVWPENSAHALRILLYALLYVGGAFFLLWLAKMLPSYGPPRGRGKSLLDRFLNWTDRL